MIIQRCIQKIWIPEPFSFRYHDCFSVRGFEKEGHNPDRNEKRCTHPAAFSYKALFLQKRPRLDFWISPSNSYPACVTAATSQEHYPLVYISHNSNRFINFNDSPIKFNFSPPKTGRGTQIRRRIKKGENPIPEQKTAIFAYPLRRNPFISTASRPMI